MIRLVPGRCTACGLCLATCPEHALRPAPRQPHLIVSSCTGCLECLEVCPVDAIAPVSPMEAGAAVRGSR